MFFVYIIFSAKTDSFYVGQTDDLPNRIIEHNTKAYQHASTAKANDWELFHSIECKSRAQAIAIEKHIKRMKNKKYYQSLKTYPEIEAKLKLTYQ